MIFARWFVQIGHNEGKKGNIFIIRSRVISIGPINNTWCEQQFELMINTKLLQ